MEEKVDVMVISAHPDDAEFGAAGTVAQWVREGKQVMYTVCTSGDKGTSDRSLTSAKLLEIREKEQIAAAAVLGVEKVIFLKYPDQGLEDTPEFRKHIVRVIRTFRPEVIVTSDPYRRYLWHRDHRIVGQVVLDAVFPFARDYLAHPDLIEAGLEPHKVKTLLLWGAEDINFRADITAFFELKLKALRCHESQMREMAHFSLEERLRERYQQMAQGTGYRYAEAFHKVDLPA